MTKPSSVEVVVNNPGDSAPLEPVAAPVARTLPTPPRLDLTALLQDPPPEAKWFWRRFYTFMVTVLSLAGVGFMIYKLAPGMVGVGIAYGLIALVGWMATLYLVAPSADEVARIFAKLAHLRQIIPSLSNLQLPGGMQLPGVGGAQQDGKVSD